MKRILLSLLISGFWFSLLNGQSTDQNYIRTITPRVATSDASSLAPSQCITSVQYYDGLGRPVETVMKSITPQMKDLVSMVEYDAFGRVSHKWQPVAMSGTSGCHRLSSDVKTQSSSFYGDENAYTRTYYDSSPLNRVMKTIGPGADWHVNDKAQRTEYLVNTATGALSVPRFVIEDNRLKRCGFYPESSLIVTLTKDEDDVSYYDFVDLVGRRIQYKNVVYVYDYLGQLRYVLPPFFFKMYGSSLADGFYDVTPETGLYKMCYVYNYDDRGNCISKKLPGIEPIYYVYDKADRPVLSQSPNQRARDEWSFIKYDVLSRPILSGTTKISGKSHGQLCDEYCNQLSKETFTGSLVTDCYGYSNTALPTQNLTILKADFYDNYMFIANQGLPPPFSYQRQNGFPASYFATPKGAHTGSIVKVFDSAVMNRFYSVFYYDAKGRVIQNCSNNFLRGFDTYFTSYDFSGSPIDVLHTHSSSTVSSLSERYHYTYDHGGRLTQATHSLNGGVERIIAQNEYDELSRLQKRSYPNNLDVVTYGYNIRGWINQIQSTHYSQTSHYGFWNRKPESCYNGNPASTSYSTTYRDPITLTLKQTGERLVKYSYNNDVLVDGMSGCIENGQFLPDFDIGEMGSSTTEDFLYRFYEGRDEDCLQLSSRGYEMDHFYEYGANSVASFPMQFVAKYFDATPTFFYDANGNLYKDLNRGITGIDYNLLNLPEKITFENGSNIRYRYDANGTKLQADYETTINELYAPIGLPQQSSSGVLSMEHRTDYCGNLIYEDNVLKKIRIDGGYINYNSFTRAAEYCYYITDQIGNNRVVLSENRGVIQYADYYPYGIPFSEIPMEEDNYLHAGKELEKMHGLYWYDNGKRWYDPILARFTTMDPLCEKYYDKNPYAYCGDNPMKYGDVNGDSINVLAVQRYDKANGTNILQMIINDLQVQTGLTLTVTSSGQLIYQTDSNGNPVVATTTDDNGTSTQVGSQTARNHIQNGIDNKSSVYVSHTLGRSGVPLGSNVIKLSSQQINGFISGVANVDSRTLGWGMTLMHELYHTQVGGGLRDQPGNPGPVVTQMNIIRSELNAKGGNYGQRLDYAATFIPPAAFLPFDTRSQVNLGNRIMPFPLIYKYIRIKP